MIVDSAMTLKQALEGVATECSQEILEGQRLLEVRYMSFDGRCHQGQIVVHADLKNEVCEVFAEALVAGFPVQSLIPVSHPKFRQNGRWSDELSMQANNSSGFNYRQIIGSSKLSMHARGRAIDINPLLNPYIRDKVTLPPNAEYCPAEPGVMTPECVVVRAFLERGWSWGGNWITLKDYHHFEKR